MVRRREAPSRTMATQERCRAHATDAPIPDIAAPIRAPEATVLGCLKSSGKQCDLFDLAEAAQGCQRIGRGLRLADQAAGDHGRAHLRLLTRRLGAPAKC